MRKWGLHCVWLLILAVVLAGCGSSADNADKSSSNAFANSGAVAVENKSDSALSETDQAAPAEAAPVGAGGDSVDDGAVKGSTAENTDKFGAGFTGSDVVAGLNKKLIYRANLVMEVENYSKAQTEVRNMVTLAQGYIIEFTENMSDVEQGGTFIMKVPASGFSSFLNSLEKVKHENLQRSIQGEDVSEEYIDLESRLKAKELMETQYTEFMKKATKSSDLVAFANELGAIQEEIEQIKGRMRYIDQNVSFSTVELRLYQTDESLTIEKKTEQGPLLERASKALNGSLHALSVLFQWLVVILAGALPVLIGLGIILAIVLVYRKKSQRGQEEQSRLIRETNRKLDSGQKEVAQDHPTPANTLDESESHAGTEEDKK